MQRLGFLLLATLLLGACGGPAGEVEPPRTAAPARTCDSRATADLGACRAALIEDMSALEETLTMTLKASELAPVQGDPWTAPRTFASSLARLQALASSAPDDVKLLAAAQNMMRDSLRFDADVERLHSSCADIAELDKGMHAVGEFTAQRFLRIIAVRRNTEIELGQRRIHAMTSKEYSASDAPAAVQKDLETAHKMPSEMQCYDPAVAKQADADITKWSGKVEADLAARKSSR